MKIPQNGFKNLLNSIEQTTLCLYEETLVFEKKKASLLLWINLAFLGLFTCLVLPVHSTVLSTQPLMVIGDVLLILGMGFSIFLIKTGRIVSAGSLTTFSLFLGPFVNNVLGDWFHPAGTTLSRYFESLVVVCFILPIVVSFSIKKRHIILATLCAATLTIGHFLVLHYVDGVHIKSTYLIYIIIAVVPGFVGLINLNLVNEAIQSLILSKNQISEWNKSLEETVARRTQELTESNRKLESLSTLDGLTSISNRRKFDSTYELEWNRAKRSGLPIALFLLDLDQFKLYNDSFGHLQGDSCLKQIARKLAENTQRAGELAARYGGEEFVIILPGADAIEAGRFAERVRSAIEQLCIPHSVEANFPYMTVSIGVTAHTLSDTDTPESFLHEADQALYRAKELGRNRMCLYAKIHFNG